MDTIKKNFGTNSFIEGVGRIVGAIFSSVIFEVALVEPGFIVGFGPPPFPPLVWLPSVFHVPLPFL